STRRRPGPPLASRQAGVATACAGWPLRSKATSRSAPPTRITPGRPGATPAAAPARRPSVVSVRRSPAWVAACTIAAGVRAGRWHSSARASARARGARIDVHQAVEQFRQPQQALAVPAHVERVAAAAQFARLRLPAAALVELAQRQAQARGDAQVGVAPRRAGAAHGLGPGLEAAARPEALAVVAELHRLVGAPGPAHLLDLLAAEEQQPFVARRIEWQRQHAGDAAGGLAARAPVVAAV